MTDADTRRAWRQALQLTQAQAARRLGLSLRTIKGIEMGEAAYPLHTERRLAMAAVLAGLDPYHR